MEKLAFRKLKAEEIELRVGATTDTGFSLLLYKTARVDANILDETVGAFNWQKKFYQVKNTMICEIGIYSEEHKTFIFKGDAGDESNTEAIKGEASDSFKRAGFAWGIGRELYTSPFIWIAKNQDNDPKKTHYEVKGIEYKDNEISKLVIVNEKTGQVVFQYPKGQNYSQTTQKQTQMANEEDDEPLAEEDREYLRDYVGNLGEEQYRNFFTWLEAQFGTRKIAELTKAQGHKAVGILKNRRK